jgi:hypothetical protein
MRARGTYKACKRPSGNKKMDTSRRVFEVEAQMLCEGFDSRFARVVRRISGWVGDALLTSRDDDGRWFTRCT